MIGNMALILDLKINNKLIYHIGVERHSSAKPKGLNPYKVTLMTPDLDELGYVTVAHDYDEGPIVLAARALNAIKNEDKLANQIIRTPAKATR